MQEIWRPAPGYEGFYEVSNLGRVKRPAQHRKKSNGINQFYPDRVLKPHLVNGYHYVGLRLDSSKKDFKQVHRLVAIAFIPNPENKPQVNHVNGDKTDNRVENLQWMTEQENIAHSVENGLRPLGEKNPSAVLTEAQVLEIRATYGKTLTRKEAMEKYGISRGCLAGITRGKTWKHLL